MNYTARPSTTYRGLTAAQLTALLTTAGYRATEFRPPQRGEAYLGVDRDIVASASKDTYTDPRIILRQGLPAAAPAPAVPTELTYRAADSYPNGIPAVPSGYRIAAFRFNVPGETVLAASGITTTPRTPLTKPFYILEPAPAAQSLLPDGLFE